MITRFRADNFKSLRDFEIRFRSPLTVIAGPNGVGKTSVCQALSLLWELAQQRPADVMDQQRWLLLRNKWTTHNSVELEIDLEDGGDRYTWTLRVTKRKGWGVSEERVRHHGFSHPKCPQGIVLDRKGRKIRAFNYQKGDWDSEYKELPAYIGTVAEEMQNSYPALWALKQEFVVRYIPSLNPVTLRRRTREAKLGDQGENFASFLDAFRREQPRQFAEVVGKLKQFFPWLQTIRSVRSRFGWTEVQVVQKPPDGAPQQNVVFKADQVADGVLRLAALATLPYAVPELRCLIFEEPENGVHPRLLEHTLDLLRSFRDCQIILTTHSPVLLNFVEPEEAVVMRPRGVEGPEARCFEDLKAGMPRFGYLDIGDVLYNLGEHKLFEYTDRPLLKGMEESTQ